MQMLPAKSLRQQFSCLSFWMQKCVGAGWSQTLQIIGPPESDILDLYLHLI